MSENETERTLGPGAQGDPENPGAQPEEQPEQEQPAPAPQQPQHYDEEEDER